MKQLPSIVLLLAVWIHAPDATDLGPYPAAGWNTDTLDAGIIATDPSIRIDAAGHPHIAYIRESSVSRNRYLTYAWFDGFCWRFESVLMDPQLEYAYLALGSGDQPCLAWQSNTKPYMLRFGTRDTGGSWRISDLAFSTRTGYLYGLEIGSDGHPHVVYYDVDWGMGEKDSHHLYNQGSGWINEFVWWFGDGAGCWGISMVLDAQNDPHFIQYNYFVGYDGRQLDWFRPVYTQRSGSSWSGTYLGDYDGDETDIVLSGSGLPRVVFQNGNLLYYASSDGIAWTITPVDPARAVHDHCALVPDGTDMPPVVYQDSEYGDLRLAWFDGGWQSLLIDSAGWAGVNLDAAVDAAGHPFIVHYDEAGQTLRLSWFGDPTGMQEASPTPAAAALGILGVTPNPSGGRLTVTVTAASVSRAGLSVYDLTGRLVEGLSASEYPEGTSEHPLDLTGLAPGVYLIRLSGGQECSGVLVTIL